VSRDQNAGQNRDINLANRSFENVSQIKYLGMTITHKNLIQLEIEYLKSEAIPVTGRGGL
jgi:hypothetical protein